MTSTFLIPGVCDSGNAARTAEVVKSVVKEFGTLDVLVNNAGVTKDGLIIRMKEEDWDSVINTNLKGAFLFCREAAKVMMKKHYGKIINISSITAVYGNAGQSNYVASKAGMIGLTLAMAKEFAAYDIQVNVVAPGFVETDMTSRLTTQQKESLFKKIVSPGLFPGIESLIEELNEHHHHQGHDYCHAYNKFFHSQSPFLMPF